ncbi:MAG: alpha/beta hydrolase, partial [Synechococcaceae cyanobacterium RL_1_2]|nr:alpha/beta hydrolase [Synechococcaceae cyanobacterium RL_1_2]
IGGVRWSWATLLRTRAGIEFNGISQSKYLGLLKRIQAPITLIYGKQSLFNRSQDLSKQSSAMADARRFEIEGGHNLHLESPLQVAEIIDRAI